MTETMEATMDITCKVAVRKLVHTRCAKYATEHCNGFRSVSVLTRRRERSKRWVNEISDQGNDEQAPHGAVPYS